MRRWVLVFLVVLFGSDVPADVQGRLGEGCDDLVRNATRLQSDKYWLDAVDTKIDARDARQREEWARNYVATADAAKVAWDKYVSDCVPGR